jgi:hypothetical protein
MFLFVSLLAVGSFSTAAAAATAQERAACRSDAMKFCSAHIGKPDQMNACLEQNKAKLSDACRKVVAAHGG